MDTVELLTAVTGVGLNGGTVTVRPHQVVWYRHHAALSWRSGVVKAVHKGSKTANPTCSIQMCGLPQALWAITIVQPSTVKECEDDFTNGDSK